MWPRIAKHAAADRQGSAKRVAKKPRVPAVLHEDVNAMLCVIHVPLSFFTRMVRLRPPTTRPASLGVQDRAVKDPPKPTTADESNALAWRSSVAGRALRDTGHMVPAMMIPHAPSVTRFGPQALIT